MKENLHKLSAGLLSLAVVGSFTGLLSMSLVSAQPVSPAGMQPLALVSTQPATVMEAALGQTAIETIVVHGHMPTNYAGLVTHRKHSSIARAKYAAGRLGGSNSVVLK